MSEPELPEALTIKIQDYGVAKEHANVVKPRTAFSLIGRPKSAKAPALESNLLQVAQQSMLHVKSLETMKEILSALDGFDIEDQVTLLKDTICNHEQIIRSTKNLVDLYLNRDHTELSNLIINRITTKLSLKDSYNEYYLTKIQECLKKSKTNSRQTMYLSPLALHTLLIKTAC